jgi:hypothetical protein
MLVNVLKGSLPNIEEDQSLEIDSHLPVPVSEAQRDWF